MQPLFILLGSALKLVNVITLVEDWKVLLGGVCVLLSWIALLVHDNYMDGDHIHGKDHYDFKWASLYVGVTCYFLVCAYVEKRMYYLRCLFTIVIVGDGI